jgi:hypothetical protein
MGPHFLDGHTPLSFWKTEEIVQSFAAKRNRYFLIPPQARPSAARKKPSTFPPLSSRDSHLNAPDYTLVDGDPAAVFAMYMGRPLPLSVPFFTNPFYLIWLTIFYLYEHLWFCICVNCGCVFSLALPVRSQFRLRVSHREAPLLIL